MRTSEDGRPLYRAKEFAKRAGVTVRTLHFYDGIGLCLVLRETRPGIACTASPNSKFVRRVNDARADEGG